MRSKLLATILLFSLPAAALDSRSLLLGLTIGAGAVVTRNYVAIPVAKATKKAATKTVRFTKHVCTLGRK